MVEGWPRLADGCGFESRPVREAGYSHAIKPNNSVARLALPGTRRPGGSPGLLSISHTDANSGSAFCEKPRDPGQRAVWGAE